MFAPLESNSLVLPIYDRGKGKTKLFPEGGFVIELKVLKKNIHSAPSLQDIENFNVKQV